MKLTKEVLKKYIKEVMKESWRGLYRKSTDREREIGSSARPSRPPRVNKRSWQKHVEPALKQLIAADPDNLLADELYYLIRHILPHEYEELLADLKKHEIEDDIIVDFETNAKALVNWQAEYR